MPGRRERAVARLRARKHREDRPFALMARDIATAGALVELGEAEEALLAGHERPIVLARGARARQWRRRSPRAAASSA